MKRGNKAGHKTANGGGVNGVARLLFIGLTYLGSTDALLVVDQLLLTKALLGGVCSRWGSRHGSHRLTLEEHSPESDKYQFCDCLCHVMQIDAIL